MRNQLSLKILVLAASFGAFSAQAGANELMNDSLPAALATSGHVFVSAAVAISGDRIAAGTGFDNYVQGAERTAMDACAAQGLPNCLIHATSDPNGCVAVIYGSENSGIGLYTGKASDLFGAQTAAMNSCLIWNDSENCHPYISACAGDH